MTGVFSDVLDVSEFSCDVFDAGKYVGGTCESRAPEGGEERDLARNAIVAFNICVELQQEKNTSSSHS